MPVSLAVPAPHAMLPAGQPAFDSPGTVIRLAAERRLYDEGDAARSFYQVIGGMVRTCVFLSDGRRQIDAFYREGDVFGFEADGEHLLAAEAVTDCTLLAHRWRGLQSVLGGDERLASWFFGHAMHGMARTRRHGLLLGRGSAAQKVAAFLLEMAERGGSDTVVDLPMGRQDIADYLGLTIETVSRTLSQMERQGTIRLPAARKVVLRNSDALRDLNA